MKNYEDLKNNDALDIKLADEFLEVFKEKIQVLEKRIKRDSKQVINFSEIVLNRTRHGFNIDITTDNIIETQKKSVFYSALKEVYVNNWWGDIKIDRESNEMVANFNLKLSYRHKSNGTNGCDFLYRVCTFSTKKGWSYVKLED